MLGGWNKVSTVWQMIRPTLRYPSTGLLRQLQYFTRSTEQLVSLVSGDVESVNHVFFILSIL